MENLRFSFLPSWAEEEHDLLEISMSQIDAGYEFKCEETNTECIHPMTFDEVPRFLLEIGANQDTDPLEAVKQMVKANRVKEVHAAIHALLKPSFVWTSTNWI